MKDFEPIGIVSLGCPKNIVDSERLLGKLLTNKFHVTFDIDQAHTVIINTCAFLQSAREEAENTIEEFVIRKNKGFVKKIIVSGCYPSLTGKKLLKEFPEVDALTGTNDLGKIISAITSKRGIFINKKFEYERIPRFPITLPHYEYLKIADGCDHNCSFCLIPKIKGTVHSFDMGFLFDEASQLVENGVKEIVLIAQDTTRYGIDLYGKNMLLPLLEKLNKIRRLEWIRLLYTYPSEVNKELIQYIAGNNKTVPYIDVPVQHINSGILNKMRRIGGKSQIEKMVGMLKKNHISIRTTVITGFPGETEKEFDELKSFITDVRFEHLGAFAFSREKGTESYKMSGQVSEKVKLKRKQEIEELQLKINNKRLKGMIGKTVPIIIDYFNEKMGNHIGRTEFDAPEIDNFVVVNGNVDEGSIYNAKIVGADSEKLFAEVKQ